MANEEESSPTPTYSPTPSSFETAASELAECGWSVLPIRPSTKKPPTDHGVHDASRDSSAIADWSQAWPDANVAVACGKSGLVVIDIDPRNGGDETLEALEKQHGELPETVAVATGGDGRHYYYRAPEGAHFRKGHLGKGIDVQAGASYVVAPPSIHESGQRYEWIRHPNEWPVEALPAWVEPAMRASSRRAPVTPDRSGIAEGQRNTTLTSLAGTLRANGYDEAGINDLLQGWNASMTSPLPEDEVRKIARSIGSRQPSAPAAFHSDFGYTTLDELRNQPSIEWMVERLLPAEGWSMLYGAPDAGKTFVAVALAASIATGHTFAGRAVKQGTVAYVGERLPELRDRLDSWELHHGTTIPADNLHFYSEFPQLAKPKQVEEFCDCLNSLDSPVSLVVIDTLSRAMTGLDDISTAVASQAVESIEQIRRLTGAAVLAVHHTVKMVKGTGRTTYRGNNILEAGCNASIYVAERAKYELLVSLDPWRVKGTGAQSAMTIALAKSGQSLAVSHIHTGLMPGNAAKFSAPPVDRAADVQSALEGIAPTGESVPKAELLAAFQTKTERSESTFNTAIAEALKRGLIEVEYTGNKNARFGLRQPTIAAQATMPELLPSVSQAHDEATAQEAVTPVAA